ncbi:DNA polymerase III subunit delta' [Novosphingobium lentum]|uniref:DNA polymerase III subunit delta' n=1 Tax=Novosphingobium lentum TaxID=145287 RepID=UPI00082C9439|nr:DNA polymerase III subunit delta' [Novosphingobium lentum]
MTSLVGHDAAWAAWRAARSGGKMHHAWILAGKRGIGKAGFAVAAAAELVAEPGLPQPAPEMHPDIHVLTPLAANDDEAKKQAEGKPFATKRNITVDQVRQMQRRLVTRPTLGSRRAVIIDAADDLEKSAVNALLKSLEEPPQGTFFLLVAHRLGRLLPTIRSRCLVLRFAPLEDADLARVLDTAVPGLDAREREAALAFSGGSPGQAIAFAEQKLGPLSALFTRLLVQGDPDLALRGELSQALGARPDRERQLAAVEAARMTVAQAVLTVGDVARPRLIEAHGALVRLAAQVPTHNFDPGLLLLEIGGLLASVAPTREGAN